MIFLRAREMMKLLWRTMETVKGVPLRRTHISREMYVLS
jgi:hypothetical protein